jgi:ATP-binding cassette, subfamily B, bacterial
MDGYTHSGMDRKAPMGGEFTPASPKQTEALLRLRGKPIRFLFHFVARHPWAHAAVMASVLVAVLCSVLTQYGLKNLVDAVSHGHAAAAVHGVWIAFAVLALLIAADNMMWRVGGWIAARLFVQVTGDVRRDLFNHLAGHSPSYFADRLPGTLSGRVTATANAIFTTENTLAWNIMPPVVAVIFSITLVTSVNPMMALVMLAISGSLAFIIFLLARRGGPLHRDYAGAATRVDGELVDVIGNIAVVRAFGATFRESKRIAATIGEEMDARHTSLKYLEKLRLLHAGITAIFSAGVMAWAVILWGRGQATPGDIVLIGSLCFTILHGTRDLAVALVDLTQHVARLEEATATLLLPHALPDAPNARPLLLTAGGVQFDHVRFAYPGRPEVLKGLSLAIKPGQRVGLVGSSGAGKSTILSLMQRFYDPSEGRILIDGQDVARVTQESLRQGMAIVPQDISLFHRSVLENIRYARPSATTAEVLHAAELARCRDFIEDLPEGFETIVGDRGTKLSGGQRQRIAIARAILKNAPLLLLDEATSALDTESEQAIQGALDTLMEGRTVVAIAHRLSTLRNFDRIIVMDNGAVVDDGSPAELSSRPGPYRDLLTRQNVIPMVRAA